MPAESLLLDKALRQGAAHRRQADQGGRRVLPGDHRAGSKPTRRIDPPTVALPVSMEVFPPSAVLDGKGEKQRIVVRAKYSDGTDRDVTSLALFLTNNDTAAKIDGDGAVTAGERGEAFVMARFHTFTIGVPFITLPKGLQFAWPNPPENNYIDTLVHAKLKKLRIEPSATCTDERVRPPRVPRHHRRAADARGVRPVHGRARCRTSGELLVDELLDRKEFAELWVLKWAELLQIRSIEPGVVQGDAALLRLAAGEDRQERADRRVGEGTARRQRRHVQEPGDELLPARNRRAEGDGERRPGVHGHADRSVPSATTTRSTAGRRTTTTGSPASSRRSAARAATTPAN